MERVFIGIYPSKKILSVIENFKDNNLFDARWVDKENIHITLQFIGWIKKEKLKKIISNINKVVNEFNSFEIIYKSIGFFPNYKKPKILWVGIEDNTHRLHEIVNKLREINKKYIKIEKKSFKPHLTIARIKNTEKNYTGKLIEEYKDFKFGNNYVDKIFLIKSDMRKEGAQYSILKDFKLK